jgi:hypothetical protein
MACLLLKQCYFLAKSHKLVILQINELRMDSTCPADTDNCGIYDYIFNYVILTHSNNILVVFHNLKYIYCGVERVRTILVTHKSYRF